MAHRQLCIRREESCVRLHSRKPIRNLPDNILQCANRDFRGLAGAAISSKLFNSKNTLNHPRTKFRAVSIHRGLAIDNTVAQCFGPVPEYTPHPYQQCVITRILRYTHAITSIDDLRGDVILSTRTTEHELLCNSSAGIPGHDVCSNPIGNPQLSSG